MDKKIHEPIVNRNKTLPGLGELAEADKPIGVLTFSLHFLSNFFGFTGKF